MPADEAAAAFVLVDSKGVVHDGRETLSDDQRPFAVSRERLATLGLSGAELADPVAVARAVRPTILLGTTGQRGAFGEELVRAVAASGERPIILPLSNPSERAEALPADILAWTDGRALVATGSPFDPVETGTGTRIVGQANNVFVFPGVGLGAMVAEARELTDDAFVIAARTLAGMVAEERLAGGAMYPPIAELRAAARAIAVALVRHFRDTGYGRQLRDDEVELAVDRAMWWPDYPELEPTDDPAERQAGGR
jgi:malic enzyme